MMEPGQQGSLVEDGVLRLLLCGLGGDPMSWGSVSAGAEERKERKPKRGISITFGSCAEDIQAGIEGSDQLEA